LIAARDTLCQYTYRCLRVAAATLRFYDSVARAMLVVDKSNGYKYNALMNQVFIARGILREAVRPMAAVDWSMFQTMVEPADEVLEDSAVVAVRSKSTELLPLPTHMINVEAPNDTYYEFNGTGECVNIITASAEELVEHAHACVDFLKTNDLIRPDKMVPFEIDQDGNLVRSHFACGSGSGKNGCCGDNCHNQQAPEYRKCWKPENNAGCGCNGKNRQTVVANTQPTVVTQRLVR